MAHAKNSPSAAHRWMNCSGSIAKIGDEPSTAGMPAMLGTAAHKVVEYMLQHGYTNADEFHGYIVQVKKDGDEETLIFEHGDPMALSEKPGWFAFPVNDEMVFGVQTMIDEVERVRAELNQPILYTERYLDGTWLDESLGGTADVTLIEEIPEWIHLFDYKNGRVVVEVDDNEQMKNYAVFLLHEHPGAVGVVVHLVQPNAQHEDGMVRVATFTADELKLFEIQMKDAAENTRKPNAPLRAGDWCMYCPAKSYCEAFEAAAKAEMYADFAEDPPEDELIPVPSLVSADDATPVGGEVFADADAYRADLLRKVRWVPLLDRWSKDIRARIMAELMNGQAVGDWKLVRGKSNRKWKYETPFTVSAFTGKWGVEESVLFAEPKLKSPAQMEKVAAPGIKRADVKKAVNELAEKPLGRIVIAAGSDSREAIDPGLIGADEFAADPYEEDEEDFA